MPHANVATNREDYHLHCRGHRPFDLLKLPPFVNLQTFNNIADDSVAGVKSIWLQNLVLGSELFLTHLDKAATLIDLYTGFHTAEQHWQPQGHTSIRDLGEFKHCRSTLAQRRLSPPLSGSHSFPPVSAALSPYLRWALTLLLLQVLVSVINPVLMAYSFCSSTHISLVYFPTLVNLGTRAAILEQ